MNKLKIKDVNEDYILFKNPDKLVKDRVVKFCKDLSDFKFYGDRECEFVGIQDSGNPLYKWKDNDDLFTITKENKEEYLGRLVDSKLNESFNKLAPFNLLSSVSLDDLCLFYKSDKLGKSSFEVFKIKSSISEGLIIVNYSIHFKFSHSSFGLRVNSYKDCTKSYSRTSIKYTKGGDIKVINYKNSSYFRTFLSLSKEYSKFSTLPYSGDQYPIKSSVELSKLISTRLIEDYIKYNNLSKDNLIFSYNKKGLVLIHQKPCEDLKEDLYICWDLREHLRTTSPGQIYRTRKGNSVKSALSYSFCSEKDFNPVNFEELESIVNCHILNCLGWDI